MADAKLAARIAALEELTDIDAVREQRAEEDRVRHAREEAEIDRQHRLRDAQHQLATDVDDILEGVRRAEGLLRAYRTELDKLLDRYAEAGDHCRKISGRETPMPMAGLDVRQRFGRYHSAVMGAKDAHLGALQWPGSWVKASANWGDCEKKLLRQHIEPLLDSDQTEEKESA